MPPERDIRITGHYYEGRKARFIPGSYWDGPRRAWYFDPDSHEYAVAIAVGLFPGLKRKLSPELRERSKRYPKSRPKSPVRLVGCSCTWDNLRVIPGVGIGDASQSFDAVVDPSESKRALLLVAALCPGARPSVADWIPAPPSGWPEPLPFDKHRPADDVIIRRAAGSRDATPGSEEARQDGNTATPPTATLRFGTPLPRPLSSDRTSPGGLSRDRLIPWMIGLAFIFAIALGIWGPWDSEPLCRNYGGTANDSGYPCRIEHSNGTVEHLYIGDAGQVQSATTSGSDPTTVAAMAVAGISGLALVILGFLYVSGRPDDSEGQPS